MRHTWALLALLLSGCTIADTTQDAAAVEDDDVTAAELKDRATLVDAEFGFGGFAFDVLCKMGGGVEVPRTDARIARGISSLEVSLTHGASTGMQLGYSVDDGEITWLPVTEELQVVPVEPAEWETIDGPLRWTFHFQNNTPFTEDQCYTGATFGGSRILVEAVPG